MNAPISGQVTKQGTPSGVMLPQIAPQPVATAGALASPQAPAPSPLSAMAAQLKREARKPRTWLEATPADERDVIPVTYDFGMLD